MQHVHILYLGSPYRKTRFVHVFSGSFASRKVTKANSRPLLLHHVELSDAKSNTVCQDRGCWSTIKDKTSRNQRPIILYWKSLASLEDDNTDQCNIFSASTASIKKVRFIEAYVSVQITNSFYFYRPPEEKIHIYGKFPYRLFLESVPCNFNPYAVLCLWSFLRCPKKEYCPC